ncbi:hypothetical protein CEXT_299501 [Caerostris extrusa]|uniref:Uncharacterized protein n=1 Tax=Caerostris extrusa TaxID=172846 RepID=A0AAV4SFC6_CAEEX|nr:hypothetical protein CEXT_299501 [Caerostris extrusa]
MAVARLRYPVPRSLYRLTAGLYLPAFLDGSALNCLQQDTPGLPIRNIAFTICDHNFEQSLMAEELMVGCIRGCNLAYSCIRGIPTRNLLIAASRRERELVDQL